MSDPSSSAAIITVAGAIIVAIISGFAAILSARRTAEARLEVESYKIALAQSQQEGSFKKEMAMRRAEVLGAACYALQIIRDSIRDLSLYQQEPTPLIEKIVTACDEIVKLYATKHFLLGAIDRRVLHDVKNNAKRMIKICSSAQDLSGVVQGILGFQESFDAAQETLIREYQKWETTSGDGNLDT